MTLICPILGRDTEVERTSYGHGSWSIVRCRETGFVFLENPPDYSQLETEFAWEKTSRLERIRRQTRSPGWTLASSLIKRAKRLIAPSRNKTVSLAVAAVAAHGLPAAVVLDVGCGSGALLQQLYHRCMLSNVTIVPIGIEVSRQLATAAHAELSALGGRVIFENALNGIDKLEDESIDLVVMCSFLEHESRPLACLQRVQRVLKDTGAVIVKVPNFSCWNRKISGKRWSGYRFPDHVNYFTPRTLELLVHQAGFQVARQSLFRSFSDER